MWQGSEVVIALDLRPQTLEMHSGVFPRSNQPSPAFLPLGKKSTVNAWGNQRAWSPPPNTTSAIPATQHHQTHPLIQQDNRSPHETYPQLVNQGQNPHGLSSQSPGTSFGYSLMNSPRGHERALPRDHQTGHGPTSEWHYTPSGTYSPPGTVKR